MGLPAGTLPVASGVSSPSPEFCEGSPCIRSVGKGKGTAYQVVMPAVGVLDVEIGHIPVILLLDGDGSPQMPADLESPLV